MYSGTNMAFSITIYTFIFGLFWVLSRILHSYGDVIIYIITFVFTPKEAFCQGNFCFKEGSLILFNITYFISENRDIKFKKIDFSKMSHICCVLS